MTNIARTLILIAALLGLASAASAEPPTLNEKVVKFCKDKMGEKVGGGECAHLAEAALQYAGAKPRPAFKDYPKEGDYVWGKLAYTLEIKDDSQKETTVPKTSVEPGDIIQFRNARFEGKNLRGGGGTYFITCGHHTSIVVNVKKEDNILTVLEQNVGGKKIVVESTYRLSDLKTGWLRIYRPVPK